LCVRGYHCRRGRGAFFYDYFLKSSDRLPPTQPFTEPLLLSLLQRNHPSMTSFEVQLLFSALDSDCKGFLSLEDFYELYEILQAVSKVLTWFFPIHRYDALELRWQLPQQRSAAAMPGFLWFKRTLERVCRTLALISTHKAAAG
jgi:hypothetical protein